MAARAEAHSPLGAAGTVSRRPGTPCSPRAVASLCPHITCCRDGGDKVGVLVSKGYWLRRASGRGGVCCPQSWACILHPIEKHHPRTSYREHSSGFLPSALPHPPALDVWANTGLPCPEASPWRPGQCMWDGVYSPSDSLGKKGPEVRGVGEAVEGTGAHRTDHGLLALRLFLRITPHLPPKLETYNTNRKRNCYWLVSST